MAKRRLPKPKIAGSTPVIRSIFLGSLKSAFLFRYPVNMKIGLGSIGKEVRDIQSRLMRLNYDLGMTQADGVFGKMTEKAVKEFQSRCGLTPTGVVDDLTWQRLFQESLFLGERLLYLHFPYFKGNDVRELQFKLVNLGFNPGPIDGVFGVKTERALKEFQQSVGLIVDGICGPETLNFLERFKGRRSDKEQVPVYPRREVTPPFPTVLKIAFFVRFDNQRNRFSKSFLPSLTERLSKIFNAWGIPCYFLESLNHRFGENDLLLTFGILELEKKPSSAELLLEYPAEGLKARDGEKLADFIAKKLQQGFPPLKKTSALMKQGKVWPVEVLFISIYFALQGSLTGFVFESEEAQQRLAGAVTEGIKEYFAWKQKR